jgi:uncharacterized protein (TIGR02145 family)
MKKLVLLLFTIHCSLLTVYCPAQWQKVEPLNKAGIKCFAQNGTDFFAGASSSAAQTYGGIYKSTDNGFTWNVLPDSKIVHPQYSNVFCSMLSIAFKGQYIFAGTGGAGIYLSADYGATWNPVNNGIPIYYGSLYYDITSIIIKGDNIFAGTKGKGVYLSTDNGATWIQKNKGMTDWDAPQIVSLIFSGNNIIALTTLRTYVSTDNAENWKIISSLPSTGNNFFPYCIASNAVNAYAGTDKGTYFSADNGLTWNPIPNRLFMNLTDDNQPYIAKSIAVKDSYICQSSSQIGIPYISYNSGKDWNPVKGGLTYNIAFVGILGNDLYASTGDWNVFKLPLTLDMYKIKGTLKYDNKQSTPIVNTYIYIISQDSKKLDSALTDNNGGFEFRYRHPDGQYKLSYSIKIKWGGATPLDALYVNRCFIGTYTFTDNLKKKAADVNNDGSINPVDALAINRRFIGLISSFTLPDWLYDTEDITVNGADLTKDIKIICSGDADGSYVPIYQFTCGDNLYDAVNKENYKTVLIGSQCWMRENLKARYYQNGDALNNITDFAQWRLQTSGATCIYNNDSLTGYIYGRIYNWYAVNDSRGLCPQGWHVASKTDVETLVSYIGDWHYDFKLKAKSYYYWSCGAGTNVSGFSGLPGGYLAASPTGTFYKFGEAGEWWLSTPYSGGGTGAYLLGLDCNLIDGIHLNGAGPVTTGRSVRCMKD